jgi:hypothetical protein
MTLELIALPDLAVCPVLVCAEHAYGNASKRFLSLTLCAAAGR